MRNYDLVLKLNVYESQSSFKKTPRLRKNVNDQIVWAQVTSQLCGWDKSEHLKYPNDSDVLSPLPPPPPPPARCFQPEHWLQDFVCKRDTARERFELKLEYKNEREILCCSKRVYFQKIRVFIYFWDVNEVLFQGPSSIGKLGLAHKIAFKKWVFIPVQKIHNSEF